MRLRSLITLRKVQTAVNFMSLGYVLNNIFESRDEVKTNYGERDAAINIINNLAS